VIITLSGNDVSKQQSMLEKVEGLLKKEALAYRLLERDNKLLLITQKDIQNQSLINYIEENGLVKITKAAGEYQLAGKLSPTDQTEFDLNGVSIGKNNLNIIAGPCAVESEEQIHTIAAILSKMGIRFLRGGAYKPRTSPYSFQGSGKKGLVWMYEAAKINNMSVVTEVMDTSLIDTVLPYADILQIGSRNMQNYVLLKELGKTDKPILLKRGMQASVHEWLLAAEYILLEGNEKVILCERGIRTFENATRNTLDLSAVPLVKSLSHLPVFVDPSHGAGKKELIKPLSKAAVAAGADGLMIEVHNRPETALSDSAQALTPEAFADILADLEAISKISAKKPDFSIKRNKVQKSFNQDPSCAES
jgi:3-deoxy-7-phosphoheptulonate synthase